MEFDWEGLKAKLTAEGGIRNKSITVTREDMTGIPRPVTGTADGIYPEPGRLYPIAAETEEPMEGNILTKAVYCENVPAQPAAPISIMATEEALAELEAVARKAWEQYKTAASPEEVTAAVSRYLDEKFPKPEVKITIVNAQISPDSQQLDAEFTVPRHLIPGLIDKEGESS